MAQTRTIERDGDGNIIKLTSPAGVVRELKKGRSTPRQLRVRFGGAPEHKNASSGVITTYTWDTMDRMDSISTAVDSITPTYTTRGELATKGGWEYTYDACGNLIQARNAIIASRCCQLSGRFDDFWEDCA